MKTIFVALVALTAATPVLASDMLARSLGVEPGRYTTAELAILKSRSTFESNEGRVFLGHPQRFTSRSVHNPVAADQFRRAARETNEGGVVD